jgi:spore coat protein H
MRVMFSLILGCLFSSSALSAAQPTPRPAEEFFGLTNLWEIHLQLTGPGWLALQRAPARPEDNPPWSACTFECGGQTLTNVAIRLKGSSTRPDLVATSKQAFKIDFTRGSKQRTFHGVKEFALNNNKRDDAQFCESLSYQVCRAAGLPTPRTAFAAVYLTVAGQRARQFLGLYTIVESVDAGFLKAHFQSDKGLLLKPEGLSGLLYLGEEWSAYSARYQPKSKFGRDDQERFIDLARLVARGDDAALERELPGRIDLSNFLRYVAVMAVLANYDSFIGTGENYYLFQPAAQGPAVWIPWDMNESFGGHTKAGPRQTQAGISVLRPHLAENRLIERVLANPKWSAAYRREVQTVLAEAASPQNLSAWAKQVTRVIEPAVSAESPAAKAAFQRAALGQTVVAAAPSAQKDNRSMSFADWVALRGRNVADELAGKRTGQPLEMRGTNNSVKPRMDANTRE